MVRGIEAWRRFASESALMQKGAKPSNVVRAIRPIASSSCSSSCCASLAQVDAMMLLNEHIGRLSRCYSALFESLYSQKIGVADQTSRRWETETGCSDKDWQDSVAVEIGQRVRGAAECDE